MTKRESGQALRHDHDLLLVEHDAVGAGQRFAQRVVRVDDGGLAVLAVDVVVHRAGLQRSRTIQRHQGDDVVDGVRLKPADEILHALGFELEDRRRLGGPQELVGRGIIERQLLDIDGLLADAGTFGVDRVDRPVDDSQCLESEKVELDETGLLDIVEVELRNHAATGLVGIQRDVVGERRRRDDHSARVLADIAHRPLELVGHLHDFRGVFVARDEFAQFLFLRDSLFERHADLERDHFGKPIRQPERLVLDARHVANHQPGRHGAEGDDLADRIVSIKIRDVGNHPLPAFHAEVDVEVRHGDPLGIQQALENEPIVDRVQIRDAEAKRHQRSRPRAAATDRNFVLTRPDHELLDDQEVPREAHLDDDAEFVFKALTIDIGIERLPSGRTLFEMTGQPVGSLLAQCRIQRGAIGYRVSRQVISAEFQLAVAALGDLDRIVKRLGKIGEQRAHFGGRAQVLLLAVAPLPTRVVQHPAFLDADPRLVGLEILLGQETNVVGGHHRYAC